MAKRGPTKTLKHQISTLVAAAAAGRADLVWLDAAIRRAGYVRRSDRLTKEDAAALVRQVIAVIEDVGLDCRQTCGKDFGDRIQKGIERLAGLTDSTTRPSDGQPAAATPPA